MSRPALLLFLISTVLVPSVVSAQSSAVAPMRRLIDSGRLPESRLPTVLELICKRGDEQDLKYVFEKAVDSEAFSRDLRVKAFDLLSETTENRKLNPAGDLSALGKVLNSAVEKNDVALQERVIKLVGLWKVTELVDELEALIQKDKTPAELKGALIDALAELGGDEASEKIRKLAQPGNPTGIRLQAIQALAGIDLEAAAESAAQFLTQAKKTDNFALLMDPFLSRPEGPVKLGAALSKVEVAPDIAKLAIRGMLTSGRNEKAIADPLSKAAGLDATMEPLTKDELVALMKEVQQKGDAHRGEEIFRREEMNCYKCHAIGKAGSDIGPDLSAIGGNSPIDYIVKSLLEPSESIKEAYKTVMILDIDGLQHTGIVVDEDDDRIILKDAQGKEKTIPVDDIEFEKEGDSLMPTGLTKFLTHQEFLDLVRYLSALGQEPEFTMSQEPTVYRWRLYQNPPGKVTGENFDDDSVRNMLFEYAPEKWMPFYAHASGEVPIAEARQASKSPVVFLMAEFKVNVAGHIDLDLTSTEGMTIWLDQERVAPQELNNLHVEKGSHRLMLRIDSRKYSPDSLKAVINKGKAPAAEYSIVVGQ